MNQLWACGLCLGLLLPIANGYGQEAMSLDDSIRAYEQGLAGRQPVQVDGADLALRAPAAPGWLTLGDRLAAAAGEPATPTTGEAAAGQPPVTAEQAQAGYVHWRERRGPAYPGEGWRNVGRDAKELPETLWDDTKFTFTNPVALVTFAAAGVSGIVLNASEVDDEIREQTDGHRELNSEWDSVGDALGSPATHFPVAAAMYGIGLECGNTKLYETSKTLINALSINGVFTLVLKWAAHTESPNGDENGWPSGHTSSSFAFATVMWKAYGPWVGVPLYAFSGYVGYERIDARNHDFSDVVSGMLIGMAVGYAVGENHEARIFGMSLVPYIQPEGNAVGLALAKQF